MGHATASKTNSKRPHEEEAKEMSPWGMGTPKKKQSIRERLSHAVKGTPEQRQQRKEEEERIRRREHKAYMEGKIRERERRARARGRRAGTPFTERALGTAKSIFGDFDVGMGETFGIEPPQKKRRRRR